jgi:uncharacterized protein YggE
MRVTFFLAALALAPAAGAPALAQSAERFAATTLDVTGHGEAHAPPDMATIQLGVVTQGPTAADAMHANADAMSHVVEALKARGVDAKDIQTSSLTLTPQYAYGQNTAPRLSAYQASNLVTVTANDLARLGPVVDAVVNAGATSVSQIRFGLKAPGAAANLARFAAVKELQDKAAIYADAAGYHVRRLVNISEATAVSGPTPRVFAAAAVAAPAPTPIETGQITVTVDVAGEFELTH